MGAVNCCIDAAAVDERAYSTCESTNSSRVDVQVKRTVSDKEVTSQLSDTTPPEAQEEEQSVACVSHVSTSVQPIERHSESTVMKRKQHERRQQKSRSTRRTQSLQYAPPEPTVWLSDYLCPCDPCPHSVDADRLLDTFYHTRSREDVNKRERDSLHRVLRGCATFDERKVLDLALVLRAYRLAAAFNGDEDKVFQAIVASTKSVDSSIIEHAKKAQVDTRSTAMRRSSAVTA